jgi:hypothetical protein
MRGLGKLRAFPKPCLEVAAGQIHQHEVCRGIFMFTQHDQHLLYDSITATDSLGNAESTCVWPNAVKIIRILIGEHLHEGSCLALTSLMTRPNLNLKISRLYMHLQSVTVSGKGLRVL